MRWRMHENTFCSSNWKIYLQSNGLALMTIGRIVSLRQILRLLCLHRKTASMGLTAIMVMDNLETKIGIALDEWRSYVGNIAAPLSTKDAEHDIINFVVLQPAKLLEPIRSKASCLSWSASWSTLIVWSLRDVYLKWRWGSRISLAYITVK